MKIETGLLIVGAGPFGLAVAAEATHHGIEHLIVGKPMEFWRRNMPKGMFLRSACDWHLDPQNVDTIESYLQTQGKTPSDVEPLALDFYLAYVEWFQQRKNIQPLPVYIQKLDANGRFIATTMDGDAIDAERVVLAPGFTHFANTPPDLKAKLDGCRYQHTCQFADFSDARDKRYLIIGGRQSAFEWAALLVEAGAASVHVSHRHASPSFGVSEWAWINELVDSMVENPSWFRRLSQAEKDDVSHRMWAEGRLKLEPWLEPRIRTDRVKLRPHTELASCVQQENGELLVTLTNGETLTVDQIVLATGYKVDIAQLPVLANGNILARLETLNGFPLLDDHFETSIPGLFITSMPAGQDFGPFFGFTVSVRTSAKLICARLLS